MDYADAHDNHNYNAAARIRLAEEKTARANEAKTELVKVKNDPMGRQARSIAMEIAAITRTVRATADEQIGDHGNAMTLLKIGHYLRKARETALHLAQDEEQLAEELTEFVDDAVADALNAAAEANLRLVVNSEEQEEALALEPLDSPSASAAASSVSSSRRKRARHAED